MRQVSQSFVLVRWIFCYTGSSVYLEAKSCAGVDTQHSMIPVGFLYAVRLDWGHVDAFAELKLLCKSQRTSKVTIRRNSIVFLFIGDAFCFNSKEMLLRKLPTRYMRNNVRV
jgi:hypothetical protein